MSHLHVPKAFSTDTQHSSLSSQVFSNIFLLTELRQWSHPCPKCFSEAARASGPSLSFTLQQGILFLNYVLWLFFSLFSTHPAIACSLHPVTQNNSSRLAHIKIYIKSLR